MTNLVTVNYMLEIGCQRFEICRIASNIIPRRKSILKITDDTIIII